MENSNDPWKRIIDGLRSGDDRVVREFCHKYGDALERIAGKHLPRGLRRRVEPEDVVQSAYRTFLRRAGGGEFKLSDSEDLWRLLCAITLNKVRQQARFHLRKKRGMQRETAMDDSASVSAWSPSDDAPTPDEAAAFKEQFEQVMSRLDEEQRKIVELRLTDRTHTEAAEVMGCSERTVRRLLKEVQKKLESELLEDA
jgi:RNA polymerase sigma-70 factor, ECF subfamily